MESYTRIEPLDGTNYRSWKYNVKLVLMERGLWGYVDGTEAIPVATETDTKEKEIKEYRLKADKAYSLIALSIRKTLQVHIASINTPNGAWEAIKKHFEFVSVTQVVRLNRAFYAAMMQENTDLLAHITHMTTLSERLRDAGEDVDDKKFAIVVLGSLPESYDNFIMSLNARDAGKLSWDEVKPLLIEEYMKRKEKLEKNENARSDDALFIQNRTQSLRGARGASGHYENRGVWNSRGGRNNNNNRGYFRGGRGPRCWNCHTLGHVFRNCPVQPKEEGNLCESRVVDRSQDYFEYDIALMITDTENESNTSDWYIDSAASSHMTHDRDSFESYTEYKQPTEVYLGDNKVIHAVGQGKVRLCVVDENGEKRYVTLETVLYVPKLAKNLLSVRAVTQNGAIILFDNEKCIVQKENLKFMIGRMLDKGQLYRVNTIPVEHFANITNIKNTLPSSHLKLWHCRYGHLNNKYVVQLAKHNLVTGLYDFNNIVCENDWSPGTCGDSIDCEGCTLGKMVRTSCPKVSENRATRVLEVVHSDVCGPMQVGSIGGNKYIVTFIDDYTRYATVYFLKKKSEVLEKFKSYVNFVENHTGQKIGKMNIRNHIKTIRTDNGGEYLSSEFTKFCTDKGMLHELTNPYTPEQNGVAERLNRTIVESVRSMIFHAKLPLNFWAEAVSTAVYVHNRSPTVSVKGSTPYERWFLKRPDVSHLRVFGCVAYSHIPTSQRQKLDPKSRKCLFVGYPDGTKGFKLLDIESKRFIRSRNVSFNEHEFYSFENENYLEKVKEKFVIFPLDDDLSCDSGESHESVVVDSDTLVVNTIEHDVNSQMADDGNVNTEENENIFNSSNLQQNNNIETHVEPVGASGRIGKTYEETFMHQVDNLGRKRVSTRPSRYIEQANIIENCLFVESLTCDINEPKNVNEALSGPHSVQWKEAMKSEYLSLVKNQTWKVVPRPNDTNVVGSRWLFKVKRKSDGSIDRFKARLVAQGFSQTRGVDYEEVFSPVVRFAAIRTLLALANIKNWDVHQMDVRTAFLNGNLDCTVFMEQPDGFEEEDRAGFVCLLSKSIYGLKQSARCWNITLDQYLKSSGYCQNSAESCIYMKNGDKQEMNRFVILIVYVDDIIPVSNNITMLNAEKKALCTRFEMVDNGEASYILGMVINRNRHMQLLTISQNTYILNVLKKFNMQDCKAVSTPIEPGKSYQRRYDNELQFDKQLYQQAIGCLIYLTTSTRPDLAIAVGILSQFSSDPSEEHWVAVKRVFRYLKGTSDYSLIYSVGDDNSLTGYSDADWGGDLDTRRSTSGFLFMIGGASVSWLSKKQVTVAKSSTEAEYVALSLATQEAIWLKQLINDIGFKITKPVIIHEDNNGAIELSKNAKYHNRTKHIDICYHFVRERVQSKEIAVIYCASSDMLADVMTKGLGRVQYQKFCKLMGVGDIAKI